eukprot:CFRG7223T1
MPKLNTSAQIFKFCEPLPFGHATFSGFIDIISPYSASVSSTCVEHSEKRSICVMVERPWHRNPFGSVHACALANLGEGCAGLAAVGAVENAGKHVRGIPTEMSLKYLAKSRGKLTAVATPFEVPDKVGKYNLRSICEIKNEIGKTTCVCEVVWTVEVKEKATKKKVT